MAKLTLKVSELLEGQPTRVDLEGKGVLVARVGEAFYAVGDRCTHLGCSLSKGSLEATIITCPCHGSKFDIRTGKVVAWVDKHPILGGLTSFMKRDVPVYEVAVVEDEVSIGGE
ncbi:MAG: Rieske (2Fe-2S) protein [Gammaproteobacteria bacterium]